MRATRTFWPSFLDGFTMAGIFGDLRIPGAPDRIFEEEEPKHVQSIEKGSELDERVGLRGSGQKPESTKGA
jgi:hypothetical protein